jgi:tetratricopeptide (TPR) repeat protein
MASLAQATGDYAAARDLYAQSRALAEALGDRAGLAATLHQMASLAQATGDYAAARDLYAQSRALADALGNRVGWAQTTFMLGWLLWQQGEIQEAVRLWEQVLPIFEKRDLEQVMAQQGFPVRLVLEQARAGRTMREWLAQVEQELGESRPTGTGDVGNGALRPETP